MVLHCTGKEHSADGSGRLLQEKAAMFAVEMGHKDFTVSSGWLYRFQIRHDINASVLSGESADVKD